MTTLSASSSLSLYGRTELDTAARVTAALRVAPTSAVEIGDPHPEPFLAAQGQVASRSFWIFDEPRMSDLDNDGRYASLDRLAARFALGSEVFTNLQEHYEIKVWIVGAVDTVDVALEVRPGTLARLALMRATLHTDIRVLQRG